MFRDRLDAAKQLAQAVGKARPADLIVLALPRGGVPLGVVLARALGAPLDMLLARKIGMPGHAKLAAGAIADGLVPFALFSEEVLTASGLREADSLGGQRF
ncbi:MAG: hypothetical protein D6801_00185 [Alphaproteobacteria bacterium]|nr:MAG: hypothetical protein D6801_00185 [Alphaproteobacteria bacterium]